MKNAAAEIGRAVQAPAGGPRTRVGIAALAFVACLCGVGTVHAGRPLTTDDADVMERGQCEWESFAGHSLGGATAQLAWQTQVGCGAGHHTQLAVGFGHTLSGGQQTDAVSMAGKSQIWRGHEGRTRLAASLGMNVLRVGEEGFDVHDNTASLVASHAVSETWTAHANLGWSFDRSSHRSTTVWNLALERSLGAGVDAAGEVFGDDRGSRWLGVGFRWAVFKASSVNLSLAVGGNERTDRLLGLGYKLSF